MNTNTGMLREITEEEIASYHRDGAVILKGILAPEWIELVHDGMEEVRNQPSDLTVTIRNSSGEGYFLIDQFSSTRNEKLKQFVMKSPAATFAGTLHGGQGFRYYRDGIFYKDAGSVSHTPWHQDTPYLNITGKDLVRVWVSCDPTPRDISLEFLRGSHLWNIVYRPITTNEAGLKEESGGKLTYNRAFDKNLPTIPPINAHRDSFDIIGWDTEPGDVIVFYANTIHGAGEAATAIQKRRAFTMYWAGDDIRYLCRPGNTNPGLEDLMGVELQSGDTLDKYPDIYPLVWTPTR